MNAAKPSPVVTRPTERLDSGSGDTDRWERLKNYPLGHWAEAIARFFSGLVEMLRIPPPENAQILRRIEMMERHIVLPIKAAGIVILIQAFPVFKEASGTLELPIEAARYFLWAYIGLNVGFALLLANLRRLPVDRAERAVFAISLVDGIFLGVLTLITGGYNSTLYWLFLGLIVRSSVSVPRATSQLLLNLTLSTCYVLAGVMDTWIAKGLNEQELRVMELYAVDNPAEPLLLRLVLLTVMTFGCYAVQVLLERQRQAAEEAREFAVREVQLHSAGRLAAEFAHQIKNPLAIINNAVFSLQRTFAREEPEGAEQVQMIKEEVERADRIITEVMGYAQLCEGHVERLDVVEELDHAIRQVFPPAARYPIRIHRDYASSFPPLLVQRRHAAETFINVLQNARDALEGREGNISVRARCTEDHSIEVTIADDGPGIPPDKLERVFEAYYTTKPKGTGLGLATVRHNLELYGGTVQVESELGKGAAFTLLFPAKTLMKLAKAK
jgi:signal transduction histidine kinase